MPDLGYDRNVARSSSLLGALALLYTVVSLATFHARARASNPGSPSLRPPPELRSLSLRYPWRGHLERGVQVPESDRIRYVDEYREHQRFFGTWQLAQLVERGAQRVADTHPGARLALGELSAEHGGAIAGHRSHRNGRDVDIGFYLLDDESKPAVAPTFVRMRASGRGRYAGQRYHFDDARNWALLTKLLDDQAARVQYIFVSRAMQHRLLAQAAAEGAPDWLVARAKTVMFEPTHGNRHQSHFHVRIYCPEQDRPLCKDRPPYYPWYEGPPPGGVFASVDGPLK